jgi:site-specific DNA-methyltransferase (adenine-specific)
MKANNGSGNIVERDEWETPQWLFDILNKQYKFDFDCCADENNKKCDYWQDDFLDMDEFNSENDMTWMNPPFSKAEHMFDHFFDIIKKGVSIYRCDNMETKIWQEIILKKADWIFIPKGRISYEGKEGKGSRFPSALIGIGIEPPKELNGVTLFVRN